MDTKPSIYVTYKEYYEPYFKEYYIKHKDKIKEKANAYYQQNKDKIKAKLKIKRDELKAIKHMK